MDLDGGACAGGAGSVWWLIGIGLLVLGSVSSVDAGSKQRARQQTPWCLLRMDGDGDGDGDCDGDGDSGGDSNNKNKKKKRPVTNSQQGRRGFVPSELSTQPASPGLLPNYLPTRSYLLLTCPSPTSSSASASFAA